MCQLRQPVEFFKHHCNDDLKLFFAFKGQSSYLDDSAYQNTGSKVHRKEEKEGGHSRSSTSSKSKKPKEKKESRKKIKNQVQQEVSGKETQMIPKKEIVRQPKGSKTAKSKSKTRKATSSSKDTPPTPASQPSTANDPPPPPQIKKAHAVPLKQLPTPQPGRGDLMSQIRMNRIN